MEKMGKLNAWEAATRAQSFSKALWLQRFCAGCISTKRPHCLSNCLMQSKHNLLSTSLQLKCIKLVGGYLHSKNVIQYETLWWNIVLTHICFSCPQTPFALFVLPAKSTHNSFPPWSWNVSLPVLQTPSYKGHGRVSGNKGTGSSALSHQEWNTGPSRGKRVSSRRLENEASPLRVYSPVRSIYISEFVLVSKHGCPWLLTVAALC